MTTHPQGARSRRQLRQERILVLCLAGSLGVHLLGYALVASMKVPVRKPVPSGFMAVEQWPVLRPLSAPEAGAGAPEGEPVASRGAPTRPAGRAARAPVDVAGEVQRTGILRALGAIGKGPVARGLPGSLAGGDLAAGLPDAPPGQVGTAGLPERRGGRDGAPAVLGDLGSGTGGGGAGTGSGGGGGTAPTGRPGGSSSVGFGRSQVGSAEVDQGKLDAFVRARIGGLRACYETQLKLDPRRDGTVRMRFAIQATGELSGVAVAQDSFDAPAMADCVVRIVRTWRTPFRPSEAVSVEYPFVFRPGGE